MQPEGRGARSGGSLGTPGDWLPGSKGKAKLAGTLTGNSDNLTPF